MPKDSEGNVVDHVPMRTHTGPESARVDTIPTPKPPTVGKPTPSVSAMPIPPPPAPVLPEEKPFDNREEIELVKREIHLLNDVMQSRLGELHGMVPPAMKSLIKTIQQTYADTAAWVKKEI